MASLTKRYGAWYIKYKGIDGRWKFKSCGTKATKADARLILSEYQKTEFNQRHKAPIKKVNLSLPDALTQFRDNVLTAENKTVNSLNREQTIINNFLNYVKEQGWKRFQDADVDAYIQFRRGKDLQPNTLIKDKRLVTKFFDWCISRHFSTAIKRNSILKPSNSLVVARLLLSPATRLNLQKRLSPPLSLPTSKSFAPCSNSSSRSVQHRQNHRGVSCNHEYI